MRRRRVLLGLAGAVAMWGAVLLAVAGAAVAGAGSAGRPVPAGRAPGRPAEVRGPGALTQGGQNAQVYSVSCGSAGNCVAGGSYTDGFSGGQGFVASERNGVWGQATEAPGLGALNAGGNAQVVSVSCPSAGNCAAGGSYADGSGDGQGFVASERNGAWSRAAGVPGLGALNTGSAAQLTSVSCVSAGNCAAGGTYTDSLSDVQGFVVAERNGAWGQAIEAPGLGALNAGGNAQVISASCGTAGNCVVGGSYTDGSGDGQGFVVGERNGAWGQATEVPGAGILNLGGNAQVNSVSCASAGNCSVGGYYADGSGHLQGFVVSERNGAWGQATGVPGLSALNAGGNAKVVSVSCAPAGNCSAGGSYATGPGHLQGFVVSERNGVWGQATGLPVLGAHNTQDDAEVVSVSCASAGNCAAGGYYRGGTEGFVASERNGVWGRASEVPGLGALNAAGNARIVSVSCGSAANCTAGGYYEDSFGHGQGFVASELNGVWGRAAGVPGLGALNSGAVGKVLAVSCVSVANCAAGGSYYGGAFAVSQRPGGRDRAIGLGVPNFGGDAQVSSMSCASAGNCAAGGYYPDRSNHLQGFVVSERDGTWGRATGVPGLAALNAGGNARVVAVSCGSAGNCLAGGYYRDRSDPLQGFVVSERDGTWGRATGVPGLAALSTGGNTQVNSVSCGSAGNCAAVGSYPGRYGYSHGFVVSERDRVWGRAIGVRGLKALNRSDGASAGSVSCASAGNCLAGGYFLNRSGHEQGFVVSQRNGAWGQATGVPGPDTDNADGNAQVVSVSCASAGSCVAVGTYQLRHGQEEGFIVSERNGVWRRAFEVPGLGALNKGGNAQVVSVSCASSGNCAAGGSYTAPSRSPSDSHGFVISERNGVWSQATEVPAPGTFTADGAGDGAAQVYSVSCGSAGNCVAGGSYSYHLGANELGFVVSERNGVWHQAIEVLAPVS